MKKQWRPYWLFAAGVLFYALFGNVWALLWCAAVTVFGARVIKPGKKGLLALFLVLDLGALIIIKYLGFACGIVSRAFGVPEIFRGFAAPVGLSFFTLQSAGYMIDLYRGTEHKRDPFSVLLFLSFFPTVSSGPILRGEIMEALTSGKRADGEQIDRALPLFMWGLFKKLVTADRIGILIAPVFSKPWSYGGWQIVLAACAFTIQLYCDFSGYSDMARASALLFGIEVPENFRAPLLSRSIPEHWRRWHISLSSWFRDYLYFPLGGSKKGQARTLLNLMIIFLVSGLWHGAASCFIVWGLLNGGYQVISRLTAGLREKARDRLGLRSLAWGVVQTVMTFCLTAFAFVFFRSGSVMNGVNMILRVFRAPIEHEPELTVLWTLFIASAGATVTTIGDILLTRGRKFSSGPVRACAVALALAAVVMLMGVYGPGYDENTFLYFAY